MAAESPDDAAAVLSDLEDDDDGNPPSPAPAPPSSIAGAAGEDRVRSLLAELDEERRARKAAEDAHAELQNHHNRLKVFAQDVIRKRDDTLRAADRAAADLADARKAAEEAVAQKDDALRQRDEALRQREEALKQKESLQSEVETAKQMLVSGIEKISGKVSNFKNFSAAAGGGGLPRSQKYTTGSPAIAYGVIKRANEIAEELVRQIEVASKGRDQAREQVEQRNYEIAIEVSQLEATIGGLREEASKKATEIEGLLKLVAERDAKVSEMEREIQELRQFGDECSSKLRNLEGKLDSQRPLIIEQFSNMSKAYEVIHEVVRIADAGSKDQLSDSLFMWKEMDMDENFRTLSEGTVSVYELSKVAVEKVRGVVEERSREVKDLNEKVEGLLAEKQHIGTLLRSALSSDKNEVLQVAENGLREAGIDLKFKGHDRKGVEDGEVDEVYTLAGALESTVKASQIEIIELQHLVEVLRAESSLLKAHLDAQAKEITQQKHQIKELEEKERGANESVEGLMMDIAVAEEEIARWKAAAEQEAAAGRAVEQEFISQLSALRQELDEAKQATSEMENKLKFKEETAAAAMAARDAAVNSLRLADVRASRLRERLEELTRQVEEVDGRINPRSQNNHRYVCWPWQWLGLDFVRYNTADAQENSNEMELSEPLVQD